MTPRTIIQAINAFLAILWPTVTLAAASTFGSTFKGVGFEAWLMVIVLSTVAGLTALLNRIAKELRESDGEADGPRIPSLRLFIASNMLGSWITGVFFFLICEHLDVPDFLEAAAVIGASYVGAGLIERTMEGAVDKLLDRVFGQKPSEFRESRTDARSDARPGRFGPRPRDDGDDRR